MKKILKKYLPILIGKRLQFLFFLAPEVALRKAFILFCSPRKGKVLPDQEYFLEEAEDEIVHHNNLQLQTYRWANMGETILLVHGWESNTHRWKTLIEKLVEKNYNVVAFDAPAHGYSSGKLLNVPVYTDCLQKIVQLYRPNHIIGHSVGAMTTIFHQHLHPDSEIEKLVLLAPPTELSSIMDGYQKTLQLSDKFLSRLNDFFYKKFGYSFEDFSMQKFAATIKNKGLLIHDILDDIAPHKEAETIKSQWQNLKFVSTEGYGHSLFIDEVDDIILDFLKE